MLKLVRNLYLSCMLPLVAALTACQQQSAPEAGDAVQQTAPDAKPGLALENGRLILPAVSGRPGAVYFCLTNGGDNAASLVAAHVDGAGTAEMHISEGGSMSAIDTIDIEPGATVTFAPGGLHVMVFDLGDELTAGGTTEMTLTFSDGDKLSAPLAIEAMGSGMNGMDHGETH